MRRKFKHLMMISPDLESKYSVCPKIVFSIQTRPLRLQGTGKETKMEIIESTGNVQMSQPIPTQLLCEKQLLEGKMKLVIPPIMSYLGWKAQGLFLLLILSRISYNGFLLLAAIK